MSNLTANVSELKARLSRYLRMVGKGKEIVVLDRNLPIAKLVPLQVSSALAITEAETDFREVIKKIKGNPRKGVNSLELLEEDRARR